MDIEDGPAPSTAAPVGTLAGTPAAPPAQDAASSGDADGEVLTNVRELMFATQDWVRSADIKISVMLAAITAGLYVLVSAMSLFMDWAVAGGVARGTVEVLLAAAVACLLVSAVRAGTALRPHLGGEYHYQPGRFGPGDLVFFGRLRLIPERELARALAEAVHDGDMTLHFAEQLRVNAEVAWRKHRQLRAAMVTLAPGAALGFAAILLWAGLRLAG